MPFDPSFTPDEFENAAKADPKILERITPVLTKTGYVVRDAATNTTYEQGLREQTTTSVRDTYDKEVEADIQDNTGIKRKDGEAITVYRKRALKEQREALTAFDTELQGLRGKSDITAEERKRLGEAEQSIKTLNENHTKDKDGWSQQLLSAKTESQVLSELGALRSSYLKTIPATVAKFAEDAAVGEIMKEAKLVDNKLVFVNADGSIQRDTTTMMPLTVSDKLKTHLKDLIDPAHKAAGAASKNRDNGADITLPEGVTTKTQLYDYLKGKGFKESSVEFSAEFEKFGGSKLPLR